MNKQELLTKLIEYYETAIKEMPEDGWRQYISKKNLSLGICHTASCVFEADIFYENWFKKYIHDENYLLCKYTNSADTRTEAISLLQIRVDIMKKELTLKEE